MPVGFTEADLDVVGGTITGLARRQSIPWCGRHSSRRPDVFAGTGAVTVVSDSYTDAALNLGGSGTDSVTIDRTNPT